LKKAFIVVILILILDQALKFWVKTNMMLGQELPVLGNWFVLHFTENEGMAFGLRFGGPTGKLMLSLFRIMAAAGIGYYIWYLGRKGAHIGLMICFGMIMAGALGNIIDSAFYGLIFSDSSFHHAASLFPAGGGYGSFLHGRVVDMLYFPLVDTILPNWVPLFGGQPFEFFRPVFNVADASITSGVLALIIFQRKFYIKKKESPEQEPEVSENKIESSS
jgi:signal peptidase II